MANTVFKLKANTTNAGATPSAGVIAVAELALNTVDKVLYTKAANGTVVIVGTGADSQNVATQVTVGNSTVNTAITAASIKLANSVSNVTISVPNTVQAGGTTYYLNANGSWTVPAGGGGGTPGGANTQVQFNDSTAFAGNVNFTFDKTTGLLTVGPAGTAYSGEMIRNSGNANGVVQFNVINANTGNNASGDLIVTADNGSDTVNYIDLGINGSGYNQAAYNIGGAGDGYVYTSNGNLSVGTASAKDVIFHTNGTISTAEVGRWKSGGGLSIGNSTVNTTIRAANSTQQGGTYYLNGNGSWTVPAGGGGGAGSAVAVRQNWTAGDGNTTFTVSGGYTVGQLDVYLNGVKLLVGSDVSAADGTTLTLATGTVNNDIIEVVGYSNVTISSVSGSDKYVQFNDGGVANGAAVFTYDKTGQILTVGNSTVNVAITAWGVTINDSANQVSNRTLDAVKPYNLYHAGAIKYFLT